LVNQKNGKIKEYVMWDQYYDTHSISKLLSENGFKIIEIKNELVENHDKTLFIVAKKV
jgi:HEPN domain-containing protein